MNRIVIALLSIYLSSCATVRFKPFYEVAEVCNDLKKRSGCLRTIDGVDNHLLYKHDSREFNSIEVPR